MANQTRDRISHLNRSACCPSAVLEPDNPLIPDIADTLSDQVALDQKLLRVNISDEHPVGDGHLKKVLTLLHVRELIH